MFFDETAEFIFVTNLSTCGDHLIAIFDTLFLSQHHKMKNTVALASSIHCGSHTAIAR